MICPSCNKEVGPIYCSKCRDAKKKASNSITFDKLIPVLYYDQKTKRYHPGCTVSSCPCNNNGVCVTGDLFINLFKNKMHDYDGDNFVHQGCG
jgi:hypothetical protein